MPPHSLHIIPSFPFCATLSWAETEKKSSEKYSAYPNYPRVNPFTEKRVQKIRKKTKYSVLSEYRSIITGLSLHISLYIKVI